MSQELVMRINKVIEFCDELKNDYGINTVPYKLAFISLLDLFYKKAIDEKTLREKVKEVVNGLKEFLIYYKYFLRRNHLKKRAENVDNNIWKLISITSQL